MRKPDSYELILEVYDEAERSENWNLMDRLEELFMKYEARESKRDVSTFDDIADRYDTIEQFIYGFDIESADELWNEVNKARIQFSEDPKHKYMKLVSKQNRTMYEDGWIDGYEAGAKI